MLQAKLHKMPPVNTPKYFKFIDSFTKHTKPKKENKNHLKTTALEVKEIISGLNSSGARDLEDITVKQIKKLSQSSNFIVHYFSEFNH